MYLCCWRLFSRCTIWVAAWHVIRSRISESSTKQELIDCHIWIGEEQDNHWRSHLYEWLRHIKRNKRDAEKQDAENVKVQNELKKFYNE